MQARIPWLAFASLALSMALVGLCLALSRPLAQLIPPLLLTWLRFALAAIAMVPWLRKPELEPPLSRHTRGLLFLGSFFGNFLYTLCILAGLRWASAGTAGMVMAALPVTVALLGWLLLREPLTGRLGLATGLSTLALLLFALGSPERGHSAPRGHWHGIPLDWLGVLLLAGALLCEAAYLVIGKRLTQRLAPRRIAALVNLWGLALSTPFGLWSAAGFDFAAIRWPLWGSVVLYSLALGVCSVWLWMEGLRHVAASHAGVFTVMLPLATAVAGATLLGETLTPLQLVAYALALAGLLLAVLPAASGHSR